MKKDKELEMLSQEFLKAINNHELKKAQELSNQMAKIRDEELSSLREIIPNIPTDLQVKKCVDEAHKHYETGNVKMAEAALKKLNMELSTIKSISEILG